MRWKLLLCRLLGHKLRVIRAEQVEQDESAIVRPGHYVHQCTRCGKVWRVTIRRDEAPSAEE